MYEKNLRKKLGSAAIAAGFANKNVSKLTTQTQKILEKERSVDSSVMDSIVKSKVTIAVCKAQGELTKINQKKTLALKRLKEAKEGKTDDASSNSSYTTSKAPTIAHNSDAATTSTTR